MTLLNMVPFCKKFQFLADFKTEHFKQIRKALRRQYEYFDWIIFEMQNFVQFFSSNTKRDLEIVLVMMHYLLLVNLES